MSYAIIPLTVGVGAYVGAVMTDPGVQTWDNAVMAVVGAMLMVGPLHTYAAAWDAGRDQRNGMIVYRRLAPARTFTASLADLAASWSAAGISYLVLSAWFLLTNLGAAWSQPNLLWLLSTGIGLLAQTTIGHLAGRVFAARITAPLVALIVFFGNIAALQYMPVMGLRNGGWLAFGRQQAQSLFAEINYPLLALQATWYIGVCLALIAIIALRDSAGAGRTSVIATAAAVTMVIGGVGTQTSDTNFHLLEEREYTYVCDEARAVCLHEAFASGLPELAPAAEAMRARVAGTPFAFTVLQQRPRGVGGEPTEGFSINIDDFDHGWVQRDISYAAQDLISIDAAGYGPCLGYTPRTETGNIIGLGTVVSSWIAGSDNLLALADEHEMKAADWFATLSDTDARRWLTDKFEQICTASLTLDDFR